jgi:hypothetical protein
LKAKTPTKERMCYVLDRDETTKGWKEDKSVECNSRVNVILEQYVSQDGNADKKRCVVVWNGTLEVIVFFGERHGLGLGVLQFRKENG